jgi:hypothetical protein
MLPKLQTKSDTKVSELCDELLLMAKSLNHPDDMTHTSAQSECGSPMVPLSQSQKTVNKAKFKNQRSKSQL